MRGVALVSAALVILGACEPYRVEYRRRPSFYDQAVDGELPDRVVLDDGTVVIYTDEIPGQASAGALGGTGDGDDEPEMFEALSEDDEGNVILRAILPEHVVTNTLWCVRAEAYEPLWEQLVADRTKGEYGRYGEGEDEFAEYFATNRRELARTLNRMVAGWTREDVVVDKLENNVFRCRLRKSIASNFKFTTVYVVVEGWGMKLLTIR